MNILNTDRLTLREFNTNDAEFIVSLLNNPTWLKYIGDRGVKTLDDAGKYITDKFIKSYATNGFGLYLVLLKNKNIPIGMCGLVKRETLEDVDLGFALSPDFFGKGYAFESAFATLNYAKTVLKIKKIVAITTAENLNSIALLKKLNFNFKKLIRLSHDDEELMLFSNKKSPDNFL